MDWWEIEKQSWDMFDDVEEDPNHGHEWRMEELRERYGSEDEQDDQN